MQKKKTAKTKRPSAVTIDKKNTMILGAGIIFVLLIALSFQGNLGFASIFTTLSSDKDTGVVIIKPDSADINIGESVTFTSYSKSGTGQVPVTADWSIKDDGVSTLTIPEESQDWLDQHSEAINKISASGGSASITEEDLKIAEEAAQVQKADSSGQPVDLQSCTGVSSCTVFSREDAANITLVAKTKDGRTAESKLQVRTEVKPSVFKETIPGWAEKVVSNLESRGIMKGYENGNFGVTDPVTRSQMIVLINKIMNLYITDSSFVTKGKNCDLYPDVSTTHFAYNSICFAHYAGWFENIDLNGANLEPEQAMQRREVAQLIYNAALQNIYDSIYVKTYKLSDEVSKKFVTFYAYSRFQDIEKDDKNSAAIGTASLFETMRGTATDPNKPYIRAFKPDQSINRVETAVMLWNFMELLKSYSYVGDVYLGNYVEEQ